MVEIGGNLPEPLDCQLDTGQWRLQIGLDGLGLMDRRLCRVLHMTLGI